MCGYTSSSHHYIDILALNHTHNVYNIMHGPESGRNDHAYAISYTMMANVQSSKLTYAELIEMRLIN